MIDDADKIIRNEPLHRIFTTVPRRYDLINHIITLGFDKRWRDKAARECLTSLPGKVLDLCCGTGDLAINFARLAENKVTLTGIDYSRPMLAIAAGKAASQMEGRDVSFIYGDVTGLPFPDEYFDAAGISFAFRNLTYRNPSARKHLEEVVRVLKPGGRYVIVESSQPESRLIRKLFHLYLRTFVFWAGYLLSGNRGAYRYLAESASRFYEPEEVKAMLLEAGFSRVSYRRLLFGASGVHVAVK
jgi:demethylmenaquinone methyltransferase/2-methoxy-6-polyprenyl-1,4-benzoquinol methylase